MSAGAAEVLNPDGWKAGLRFALKTLNTKSVSGAKGNPRAVLPVCFRHNLRMNNDDHRHRHPIDPARSANNTVLLGSSDPEVCAALANNILEELAIEPRRVDNMTGIELVFQPPPGWDVPQFYAECLLWVGGRYQHLLSAVVHRDQQRPHMHVLVLAVVDGKLAGAAMTSNKNRPEAQWGDFMASMRKFGLRPDRDPAAKQKPRVLVGLATSAGKGPKTHAAAAKSDAALMRRAAAGEANHHAHQPPCPSDHHAQVQSATSYCAALSVVAGLFERGVLAGIFSRTPARSVTAAPPPPCGRPRVLHAEAANDAGAPPAASPATHRPFHAPGGVAAFATT